MKRKREPFSMKSINKPNNKRAAGAAPNKQKKSEGLPPKDGSFFFYAVFSTSITCMSWNMAPFSSFGFILLLLVLCFAVTFWFSKHTKQKRRRTVSFISLNLKVVAKPVTKYEKTAHAYWHEAVIPPPLLLLLEKLRRSQVQGSITLLLINMS